VGRITASSAEATADNAWGRYSPYRLLPPRVGRITATRLSATSAGVSADNAWGVIRPTACPLPV
ncbi:hypothetical protein M5T37_24245, partial [Escherichia coli]|uniref:hypothetical protein n=1 Tax=Escherichia coli TaxID=562 RepID=UPI0021625FE6